MASLKNFCSVDFLQAVVHWCTFMSFKVFSMKLHKLFVPLSALEALATMHYIN